MLSMFDIGLVVAVAVFAALAIIRLGQASRITQRQADERKRARLLDREPEAAQADREDATGSSRSG
jgi:hypothetical protein